MALRGLVCQLHVNIFMEVISEFHKFSENEAANASRKSTKLQMRWVRTSSQWVFSATVLLGIFAVASVFNFLQELLLLQSRFDPILRRTGHGVVPTELSQVLHHLDKLLCQ